ncbi:tyrosine recombinase XerS [Paenibacillus sp. LMG 31458]|uniref:Tyrosine recombinase XerS n=1 Tax=Paenibacillus phytorum TaxID=2654977 RepID=A0ABX1Y4B5_9BACL|nr:tyrosine recombinase XerS [Paenibacillus phytorum]NOU75712.1 tyrosine recombinase XerS [Paenibacillus phytorum]
MDIESKQKLNKRTNDKLILLPWFIKEYINKKRRTLSPATLLNYCHDFIIFLEWLIKDNHFTGNMSDVPLTLLEKLTTQQIEEFLYYLELDLDNSKLTVNRKLSALKSLFNYLQNQAETKDLKPYLERNVMAKIEFNSIKEDQETIANRIGGKILRGDEFEHFRLFVAYDYGELNKKDKKLYNFHQRNRERDTAIISLILGSGLRLSEIVGCEPQDLDLKKCCVRVIRKGNKEQYVYFSELALHDLEEYLKVREERYQIDKTMKALFIAASMGPVGTTRRLTPRSVEKMVEKYAIAHGRPALTVHTLRHSFATRYHQENNDVPKLRNQLGHSAIQTTMIYTHLTNDELKKAVDNMDGQLIKLD